MTEKKKTNESGAIRRLRRQVKRLTIERDNYRGLAEKMMAWQSFATPYLTDQQKCLIAEKAHYIPQGKIPPGGFTFAEGRTR